MLNLQAVKDNSLLLIDVIKICVDKIVLTIYLYYLKSPGCFRISWKLNKSMFYFVGFMGQRYNSVINIRNMRDKRGGSDIAVKHPVDLFSGWVDCTQINRTILRLLAEQTLPRTGTEPFEPGAAAAWGATFARGAPAH